ncbi:DeoR/GlpR family DNA-binding transcription regulator [Consotaella salsifontis]|uniref:Transcriptional regulator, DeoR family n=1 Tax=Consotaella salsifontis TaxID=1365950 RepID=A0A1T4T3T2_9HYPH|nr:DeoR/GlpR family DNA-binding transcription regulator [Consotaella salsifontis]SKA35057.1 transcriptional regulator, DeoR family [Consotaella salsifontis]
MLKEDRLKSILKYIEGKTAASYRELSAIVDVSSATLRRDVEDLDRQGLLRRVRGGVAPLDTVERQPLPSYFFSEEEARHADAKDAIASAALSLCHVPDTLILFGGTTVARFAEHLPRAGLTVLTNSLPVVNHLTAHTDNRTFMTGGQVFGQSGIVLSPFEADSMRQVAASTFFIGCHAVSTAGILEEDPMPIQVFNALRRQAERLVVLADSSKFLAGRSLVLCPLKAVDVFVTDDGISERSHQMLVDEGVTVLVAPTGRVSSSRDASRAGDNGGEAAGGRREAGIVRGGGVLEAS